MERVVPDNKESGDEAKVIREEAEEAAKTISESAQTIKGEGVEQLLIVVTHIPHN